MNNMLKKAFQWFEAPIFGGDEEKTRKAMLLNIVINACLVALPLVSISIILGGNVTRYETILSMNVCAWLLFLGTRLVMRSGKVLMAGVAVVVILFISVTVGIYSIGTLHSSSTFTYIIIILIACLSIGCRTVLWTTLAASMSIILLWLAEENGILPKPDLTARMSQPPMSIIIFIVVAILVFLAINSMDKALARAREEINERMLAKEREAHRREMMEKVIRAGKAVTEKTPDLRTVLFKIWDSVRMVLDFDRAAIFLYDPETNMMQGSYGTDRSGKMSEEWDLKFGISESNAFFRIVLSQPDSFFFTSDYETECGLLNRPDHIMRDVKYYVAVGVWTGDKPLAIICVDQLLSGRVISDDQLEALRFFAGYAGLAIENARLSEREQKRREMMEKVIEIGKNVAEQTTDLRATLFKIRKNVRNNLDFDRVAFFLYDPESNMLQGSYGTDRSGNLSEEWDFRQEPPLRDGLFKRPDGFYFTKDYESGLNITSNPEHPMRGVKHYAAVACWSEGKPVGMICVDQLLSGRSISDEQLDGLRFFAGYAGLAIENARLGEREKKRREMMGKVIEIGKNITKQTTALRTTLFNIRESARDHIDLDRVAIFLYNETDGTMQGSYGTDRSGNLSEEWNLRFTPLEDGFLQRVISQPNGFYHAKDYELELKAGLSPDAPMKGVKHYVAVSCWSGDKPIAVLCADQLVSGRSITDEQLEALRFFAGYVGLAIENARFNEREQYRQKMMEKVIQMGKTVTEQTNDLRATFLHIRDSVRNELDLDRAAVFLYDTKKNILQGTYGTDRSGNLSEEWDIEFTPAQNNFMQNVISQPDGFIHTKDYELDFKFGLPSNNAMRGVKHYAAVACWNGDKPVAVICGDQLITGRAINDEQLEAMRLFAGYAGLAIDNARLNTELKSRMQEREQFIQELGNRNTELERFTYTVSHDLRSPIITIKGFIGMLEKDMRNGQKERVAKDMLRISNATDKMDSLLSDLLELSRIGRIINPPEEIDLVQLAYDTLETVDGRLRAKNISTDVAPDLPVIKGDLVRIGEVLENLLDNAAKYMGDQKDPHIEIGTRNDGGEQVIYVKDNGIGIEPQYLQRVFGLFEKLDPTSEGTGIGLALIKRIIEVHGGKIWVESEGKGKGSTFCFIVPDNKTTKNGVIHGL
jgi:signal transduction histidine kinase